MTAIAKAESGGALLETVLDGGEVEDFRPLDQYAAGYTDEPARIDALATVSAGYRAISKDGKLGLPQRSTDGTIFLHDPEGRAPGLKAALAKTNGKRLTIAFPLDDPKAFVQMRFVRYSATRLEAYGDEKAIELIGEDGKRQTLTAGTPQYAAFVKDAKTKCAVSVYFCLAEWTPDGPQVVFPDGFGYYRLRTTSRNTLRSLESQLKTVSKFTRGHIAGVPFDLSIDYPEVADPSGRRRKVPVFRFVCKPPQQIALTSKTFSGIVGSALSEGQKLLALPAPVEETVETAAYELIEPTDDEIAAMENGGLCDPSFWRRAYHASVQGTDLAGDDARHELVRAYTNGAFESLEAYLAQATEKQASDFMAFVRDQLPRPEPVSFGAPKAAGVSDEDPFAVLDATPEPEPGPEPEEPVRSRVYLLNALETARKAQGDLAVGPAWVSWLLKHYQVRSASQLTDEQVCDAVRALAIRADYEPGGEA